MAWSWPKKPAKAEVERRAATAEELRVLRGLGRPTAHRRIAVSLLVGLVAAVIAGSIALGTRRPSAMSTGIAVGSFVTAGLLLIAVGFVGVLSGRRLAKMTRITAVADPLLSPVVPVTEGDRAGGWVVIDADTDRLHVARAQSLASFKLARLGALVGATAVVVASVALTHAALTAAKPKYTVVKLLFFAGGFAWWMARFALSRSAYQWTIEEGEAGPQIVMQDAALFGASRLLTVYPAQVANFAATPHELAVVLQDGTVRPLGGLGGGPLAPWRAACIATTVAGMLDIRVPLVVGDDKKTVRSISVPGDLADEVAISPSTDPKQD
jgi:hypothetical protein